MNNLRDHQRRGPHMDESYPQYTCMMVFCIGINIIYILNSSTLIVRCLSIKYFVDMQTAEMCDLFCLAYCTYALYDFSYSLNEGGKLNELSLCHYI